VAQMAKGPDRTLGYALLGSTLGTAAGSTALFLLAQQQRLSLDTVPQSAATTRAAFLASGVSLGLAGLTAYAFLHAPQPAPQGPRPTVGFVPLREGGQVSLSGRF